MLSQHSHDSAFRSIGSLLRRFSLEGCVVPTDATVTELSLPPTVETTAENPSKRMKIENLDTRCVEESLVLGGAQLALRDTNGGSSIPAGVESVLLFRLFHRH